VTVIGQNVNAYSGTDAAGSEVTLAGLIDKISAIDEIVRIRYTTSHPRDMLDDLIIAHRDNPKLMPFLHLPVQSGSDRILAAMNRKHGAAEYLALVEKIRRYRPGIAMSSDFIVGFPGESDDDFEQTLALMKTVRFASVFSFKYSARPGTPASSLSDHVPAAIMTERLARLQELAEQHRQEFNTSKIGEILDVLFEKPGRYQGQLVGKTPYWQTVQTDAPEQAIGKVYPVRIVQKGTNSLFGELVDRSTEKAAS